MYLLLLDGMLYQSIKSNMSFEVSVSLLIFCLDHLSADVSRVLKVSTILHYCWFLPLWLLVFALYIEVLLCWVSIHLHCYIFLLNWSFDYYVVSFVSCNSLYFKVYFVLYVLLALQLLIFICMEYLFLFLHFQSVCVSRFEVGLL